MLDPARRYHFLGIGGVGMSAIAELLHRRGFLVAGSDARGGDTLDALASAGIRVAVGHDPAQLDAADAVVYSSAIAEDHPIWREVERRGLPKLHRSEVLGELTRAGKALAVSGTHGKTTSTACLAVVLEGAGWRPTALVGGHVPQFGGKNFRAGAPPGLVVEADESDGSFRNLSPWAILLTNVEADHLDRHGSLENLVKAFAAFLERLPRERLLVFCKDDPQAGALALAHGEGREKRSYGSAPGADVRVVKVHPGGTGMRVELEVSGESIEFTSRLAGNHNALNLAGVLAMAEGVGVPRNHVLRGLAAFKGVSRRQQYLGSAFGCRIFDDYAHHPTEVQATLEMFLTYFREEVTVVFQPHLYSRTAHFAEAFAEALRPAHRIFLTGVYGAREAPLPGIDGNTIMRHLKGHPGASLVSSWEEILPAARRGELAPGILITMGAGDITGLGPRLLEEGGA